MSRQAPAPHPVELAPPPLNGWRPSSTGVPWVHERATPVPGPEVLITALVHGNEYSGAWALDAFLRSGLQPRRGRITGVFCNTEAYARFDSRYPDASRCVDVDFNRIWSAEQLDGPQDNTELRRARAIRPFVDRATHLLDLHSMHEPSPPLFVTGLHPRNLALAQQLGGAAQVIIDGGHADGVRLRDHGPFGDADGDRLAILLEAGHHWERASLLTARNVLMRFLVVVGALDHDDVPPGWLLPDQVPPPPLTVTHRVVARSMDFAFVQDYRGGEVIEKAGTVIATDGGEPVRTPYDGCVLVMPSVRQLRPGVTTVRLARAAEAYADA